MSRLPITPPERGQRGKGARRVLAGRNHQTRVTGGRKCVPLKIELNYSGGGMAEYLREDCREVRPFRAILIDREAALRRSSPSVGGFKKQSVPIRLLPKNENTAISLVTNKGKHVCKIPVWEATG